jgi:hypothetical protein
MMLIADIDWSKAFDGYAWFHAFVSAVFGAFFGALVAIKLTQRQNTKRKQFAKTAVAERLHVNAKLATQMLEWFAKDGRPNYLFDTTGIVVWLTMSADILESALITDINWHRYQLDHLNAKLLIYYFAVAAVEIAPTPAQTNIASLTESKLSICQQLREVIDKTCDLEKRISAL